MTAVLQEASETVDISGIDKAVLLASLYNAARSGAAALNDNVRLMTPEDAARLLEAQGGSLYFHMIDDRVIRLDLGRNWINTSGYDEAHGAGRVAQIVRALRRARAS
jgi:hypothetical protein